MKKVLKKLITLSVFLAAASFQVKATPQQEEAEKPLEDKCAICLDSLYYKTNKDGDFLRDTRENLVPLKDLEIIKLRCGHELHRFCFHGCLASQSPNCPLCRQPHNIPIPATTSEEQLQPDQPLPVEEITLDTTTSIRFELTAPQGFDSAKQILQNHTNIVTLDLSLRPEIRQIPEDFFVGLTHIKELRLTYSQLTSLPDSIENLTGLRKLYLVANQLTSLPETIGNLTNLQVLHLQMNKLTTLPDSIGNLTNLWDLLIFDNKLISLPNSIENLTFLLTLDLSDNHIVPWPTEFINRVKDRNRRDPNRQDPNRRLHVYGVDSQTTTDSPTPTMD